jgi:hypothetical protein
MKTIYTFADLRDWEKRTRDLAQPIRLGVLGDPIAHSRSAEMQNAALEVSEGEGQNTGQRNKCPHLH